MYPTVAKGIEAMDSYWKKFWNEHAKSSISKQQQHQVLRTLGKKPVTDEQFLMMLKHIEKKMNMTHDDVILDLCCGNGLFTVFFASKCKKVVGVDFARELIAQIDPKKYKNILVKVEDVRKVNFKEKTFDKVFVYAGLQYLTYKETVYLFEAAIRWLRSKGLFFIGDIPDKAKMWDFFNTEEREYIYFDSLKNEKPIIGTWFDKSWLLRLGKYVGFKEIKILKQPQGFPYSHYRFDMILKKS